MTHVRRENRQTLFNWLDLPIEETPVERLSLQELEERLAEFIWTAEAHIRQSVLHASELETLPGYKEAENEVGDVVYVREENAFYHWNPTSKKWESIPVQFWKPPVTKVSELPGSENTVGDVRLVTETSQFYIWHGSEWKAAPSSTYRGSFANEGAFPAGGVTTEGDVLFNLANQKFYYANASKEWKLIDEETTIFTSLTWAISEKVTTGKIPGPFFKVGTNEKQFVLELEANLIKGEAKFKLLKNGTALKFEGGGLEITVKEAAGLFKLEKEEEFKSKDHLVLECTEEKSTPEGLSFTVFVKHVAKVV